VGVLGTRATRFTKTLFALALLSSCIARPQALPPDLPIENWLRGPEREDFKWKVKILPSWLTFQQRHAVQVQADFHLRELRKRGISTDELHIVLKVATPDGEWLPGQAYNQLEIKSEDGDDISTVATLYARPGKYQLALIAYDSRHQRGNLWRADLTVPGVKKDPLPGADRSLPVIQFLPPATLARSKGRFGTHRILFDASAFGEGKLTLAVLNDRPVQIDILANVALSDALNVPGHQAPDWLYKVNADTLLQASNVLSQLDLKHGCVRFSAMDILRQKAFVDREDAAHLDWNEIVKQVQELQRVKIEARVLANRKQTAGLFAKFIDQLLEGPGCEFAEPPVHVLIVVGDAFIFPTGTVMRTVQSRPDTHAYYLKLMPIGAGNWDQVEGVLKPLRPSRFEFANSLRFRAVLATLITRIQVDSRRAQP
jgi:hypothetical protein